MIIVNQCALYVMNTAFVCNNKVNVRIHASLLQESFETEGISQIVGGKNILRSYVKVRAHYFIF